MQRTPLLGHQCSIPIHLAKAIGQHNCPYTSSNMAAPIVLSAPPCGKCLNCGFLLMRASSTLISAPVWKRTAMKKCSVASSLQWSSARTRIWVCCSGSRPKSGKRPNPHWTRARKDNFFDVAWVQCEHSHSQHQVPFSCVAPARPVWIRPFGNCTLWLAPGFVLRQWVQTSNWIWGQPALHYFPQGKPRRIRSPKVGQIHKIFANSLSVNMMKCFSAFTLSVNMKCSSTFTLQV